MSVIKKDDIVAVIAGASRGKTGKVLKVIPSESKVIVEGVNSVTVHQKPSQASEGGRVAKLLPIHISNVMLIDPKTKKPTRVRKTFANDKKQIVSVKSGEEIRNV